MKSILLSLLLFLLPNMAPAQQGTVRYEERVRLDIQVPPEMQHMRGQFPSETRTDRLLLFDGLLSLMKSMPPPGDAQVEPETGRARVLFMGGQRISGGSRDDETFTDYEENVQIDKVDFLERTFLITGEPRPIRWRMTGEQAEFLGYVSQKAVATTEDSTTVEAWFTPEIAAPVGPGRYGGLPGLILVLNEDDGRRSYVAKEVSLQPLAGDGIQAPTRGRQVSREEFDAIVEERMREMRMQGGRGATIRIAPNN